MNFKYKEKLSNNANYIKLTDGKSVSGILVGDPHEFYKAFKEGDEPKFRFKVNMVIQENGMYTAKILEMGASVYKALADLQDEGWDLDKTIVSISRKGTMLQTEYSVVPKPVTLSQEQLDKIKGVRLHDLLQKSEKQEESGSNLPF